MYRWNLFKTFFELLTFMLKSGSSQNSAVKWNKINDNELKYPEFTSLPGKLKTLSNTLFHKFIFFPIWQGGRELQALWKGMYVRNFQNFLWSYNFCWVMSHCNSAAKRGKINGNELKYSGFAPQPWKPKTISNRFTDSFPLFDREQRKYKWKGM